MMIANIIAITSTVIQGAGEVIVFIWNLIETQWQNRETNWEDE